jgi:hypothetical protein
VRRYRTPLERRRRCPVCQDALLAGNVSWWAILGMLFNLWPGHIWLPDGYAHRSCFAWYGDVVRKRDFSWRR